MLRIVNTKIMFRLCNYFFKNKLQNSPSMHASVIKIKRNENWKSYFQRVKYVITQIKRNLWKDKPSELNRQSESLCTH